MVISVFEIACLVTGIILIIEAALYKLIYKNKAEETIYIIYAGLSLITIATALFSIIRITK